MLRWSQLSSMLVLPLFLLVVLSPIFRSPFVDAFQSPFPPRRNVLCWEQPSAASEENVAPPPKDLSRMERAWRHVKKPLLSLGAQKGATIKHGNSLRELLQQHTMVKVKIQLLFRSTSTEAEIAPALVTVYEQLREYAVQSGASPDLELLQVRPSERTLLIALPGTRSQIEQGTFPPRPAASIE
jgi:RNA-binding protein YhbY